MKFMNALRRFARPASLILAAIVSVACLGCSGSDVSDMLDLAGDVLEIIDEIEASPDTTESAAYTESAEAPSTTDTEEAPPPDTTKAPVTTKAPETTKAPVTTKTPETTKAPEPAIDEDGSYFSKDEVALYIHTYGRLPENFITKSEAQKLGWEGGSVQKYAPGCAIGGDIFGNREGLLPKKSGRTYKECDIDTDGENSRGAKRIVFSNDGLIYYTDDHYESFKLLYGEE